jgi:hypothetical protein
MQNVRPAHEIVLGHDVLPTGKEVVEDHEEPFQVVSTPLLDTARQKVGFEQETSTSDWLNVGSAVAMLHVLPLKTMRPCWAAW